MDTRQIIKKLRLEKSWTQEDVALRMGVKKQTISQYEKGVIPLSVEKIKEFATIFEVEFSYLLGGIAPTAPVMNQESKESSLLEELRTTLDYVKGQIDVLNGQLAASSSEKARLLDVIDRLTVNFPEGNENNNASVMKFYPELIALKAS